MHLKTLALANADEAEYLTSITQNPTEKIDQVTQLYDKYNIKALATKEMEHYLKKADQAFNDLAVADDQKTYFRELVQQILERER